MGGGIPWPKDDRANYSSATYWILQTVLYYSKIVPGRQQTARNVVYLIYLTLGDYCFSSFHFFPKALFFNSENTKC